MNYKIIIHDGKAHMDELLASAFYIHHRGEMPQNIERIDSSEAAERAEKMCDHRETVFLDCGLIHDGISKFDHHQDAQLPLRIKTCLTGLLFSRRTGRFE